MRHFGIIGNPLGHSWSAQLFNKRFAREGIDARYALNPLTELNHRTLDALVRTHHLEGFSVTIPYKQTIIPLLDEVTETARAIGAVNVVKAAWNGDVYRLTGYNTDYIGFRESLLPLVREQDCPPKALVLGTGGAAQAVAYALSSPWDTDGWMRWEVTMVSRKAQDTIHNIPCVTYGQLTKDMIRQCGLIVNCTPLGMFPETDACPPIPYEAVGKDHILYDCIYNPEETLFLHKGRERGARTQNGRKMLELQAQAAWEEWNN